MLFLNSACSVDYSDPLYDHQDPAPEAAFETSEKLATQSGDEEIDQLLRAFESGEKSAEECLEVLRPRVLNSEAFQSDEVPKTRGFIKALSLFSRILSEQHKSSQLNSSDLGEFKKIFVSPCMSDESQCRSLGELRGTPYLDELVVIAANSQETSLADYYKMMFIAFDLGNSRTPSFVLDAYFARFKELAQSDLFKNGNDEFFYRRHMILLGEVAEKSEFLSDENILSFLLYIEPWKPRSETNNEIENSLKAMSFGLFANHLKKSTELKSAFKAYINNTIKSYEEIQLGALKKRTPLGINMIEKLNIDLDFLKNELSRIDFFFAMSIYKADFGIQEVTEMRRALGVQTSFYPVAQSGLQLKMAEQVKSTNEFMRRKFIEKTSSSLSEEAINSTIFDSFLYEAQLIGEEWMQFTENTNLLKDLSLSLAPSSQLSEINKYFASVDRNIEMVVTYALMMPLMVQMSKMNYNQRIKILWFEFVISARSIMAQFFRGYRRPWFKFTTELNRLYPHELILSFYYSIAIDGFSAFNTSVKEFLEQAYERLIQQNVNRYRIYTNQLVDTYLSTGEFQNLIGFCFNPNYTESLRFEDLDDFTQGSFETYFKGGSSPGSPSGYNYYSEVFSDIDAEEDGMYIVPFAELLDSHRTEFLDRMKLIKRFYQIAKEHSQEDLSAFQSKIDEAEKVSNLFMTRVVQVHEISEACQSLRIETERKRQVALIQYEREYLKDIYKLAQEIQKGEVSLESANGSLKFDEGYPDNYKGFDHFEKIGNKIIYHFHKLDLMRRVRNHLSTGYQNSSGESFPAIALFYHPTRFEATNSYLNPWSFDSSKEIRPRVEISIPGRLRNNSGLQVQIDGKPYSYFSNKFPRVSFQIESGTSEEQFLGEALELYNSRPAAEETASFKNQMGKWQDQLSEAFFKVQYYSAHFQLILYKMGDFPIYDFERPECLQESSLNTSSCLKTYRIEAKDLVKASLKSFLFADISEPEEVEVYGYLKRRMRPDTMNPYEGLAPTLFNPKSQQPLGVFNYIMAGLSQELLGNSFACLSDRGCDAAVTRVGDLKRARDYHLTEGLKKIFFFPVALGIKQDIFSDLKVRVHHNFNQIATFEREMKLAIQEIATESNRHSSTHFQLNLMLNSEPLQVPWLESNNLSSETAFETFNEDTEGLFE